MASSSTTTFITHIQQKYDVFISFRGTDTRDNITSHVYDALCRAKIETFIDNDLKRGDDISDAILRTIADSKISVIIFSENYGSSRWCLDELVKIMECNKENRQIVIPVFFKVDPSHLRKQSGPFEQALARYGDHPKIQTWRDALTKAANLSGWDSQVTWPEAKLVKRIVKDILDKISYTSSSNFGNLVGMTSRFEEIDLLLSRIKEDVRIIGFWGMGGIGKTTLARAFFNRNMSKFDGHCMIENIRETCEKQGLNYVHDKLVAGLLKDEKLNVGTPNLGIPFIRNRLRRKKVLTILDDVNDFQHVELLVGQRDFFGPGSIIIITSRDQRVLKNIDGRIYEVPRLDYNESLCLFSQYAFKQERPTDGYHKIVSKRAMNYAKGHPLALKILGSHLRGRSKQVQESALKKLERSPNMDVQQVLHISYDGLEHQEKNLFLNIACLFKGEDVNEVKYFHDACNHSTDIELDVLIEKSLITVFPTGQVWMHDLLQEMGRQIVREESIEEPGKRSRLWDHHDICEVLTKNTGTVAVKGILFDMFKLRHLSINPVAFERMSNLEFLKIRVDLSALCLPQGLKSLPNKLRYLHWKRYPLTYLPSKFRPENLVQLIMPNSHVERLWNGRQNLVHLKGIDLSNSKKLIEIPDLSLATNLRYLNLLNCDRLENVQVSNVSNLKYLNLWGCTLINKFPEVPLEIQHLYLSRTAIEEVPSTICNFKSLVALELGGCTRLKNIPTSIYKLKPLRRFGMCFPLKEREHQQDVNIHLRELTCHLDWLSSLERLGLCGSNFQKIPFAIKQLTNLKFLHLRNCRRLQSLPQLPMNIQGIYAANCISLQMVASPLSTSARGVFDSHRDYIWFDFSYCCKLDQNAINNILADVESRLLHWKATYPETLLSQNTGAAFTLFSGGDVPHWFKYKRTGSSLITELLPQWCNDGLFCLVFCVVIEWKHFPRYFQLSESRYLSCYFHLRNNRGDISSRKRIFDSLEVDFIGSNAVYLIYDQSLVNDWRRVAEEADDADEISIEFNIAEDLINYGTVKTCGVHLLYTQEIENRHGSSVVLPNSRCGDLIEFFSERESVDDDIEESVIEDTKDNGGFNVASHMEDSAPVRRRKTKRKPKALRFLKSCWFGGKSTQKRA